MTKGSVIVNGVEFTTDINTTITADDNPKGENDLQSGMTVKVKGTINDDGINGKAEKVEVVSEVRGAITSKNTDILSIHNQTVLVDGATIFSNVTPSNISGLANSNNVEVHGQRDANGTIRATRIEKLAAGAVDDEVRGTVSNKTATSLNIGTLAISTNASTTILPAGATFADGDIVQVHLSGATATKIKVEHAEVEFEPAEGEHFEVEGFVGGLGSGSFKINDQQVQTSSTTLFDGGVSGDLVDGIKVEAEGHLVNGNLVANKIAFKESIRIESNATTTGSANVLDLTVKTTSKTENLADVATIVAGDGVRIRGFQNIDGSITATRVDIQSPDSNGRSILRAPVTDVNPAAKTFKLLGITINALTSTARPNDDNSNDNNTATITPEIFFSSLTDGKTVVKAKGTFSGGTLSATEIEIE
jgi:hypothetical protein